MCIYRSQNHYPSCTCMDAAQTIISINKNAKQRQLRTDWEKPRSIDKWQTTLGICFVWYGSVPRGPALTDGLLHRETEKDIYSTCFHSPGQKMVLYINLILRVTSPHPNKIRKQINNISMNKCICSFAIEFHLFFILINTSSKYKYAVFLKTVLKTQKQNKRNNQNNTERKKR